MSKEQHKVLSRIHAIQSIPARRLACGDYIINLGRVLELSNNLPTDSLEVVLQAKRQKLVWRFDPSEQVCIYPVYKEADMV